MSSSETLVAQEDRLRALEAQQVDLPPQEEFGGYTYEREDGTIEHAQTREEALKVCPVLGKLALESPEQVDVMLNLAAMGQQKMKAETEAKAVMSQPKNESRPEKISSKKPEKQTRATEVDTYDEVATATAVNERVQSIMPYVPRNTEAELDEKYITESVEAKEDVSDIVEAHDNTDSEQIAFNPRIKHENITIPDIDAAYEYPQEKKAASEFMNSDQHETHHTSQLPEAAESVEQASSVTTHELHTKTPAFAETIDLQTSSIVEDVDSDELFIDQKEKTDEILSEELKTDSVFLVEPSAESDEMLQDAYEIVFAEPSELITHVDTVEAAEGELYEPEVLEAFEELVDIITHQEKPEATEDMRDMSPLHSGAKEEVTDNVGFDNYLEAQPAGEDELRFKAIVERAVEQPLEETLVELVAVLQSESEEQTVPASFIESLAAVEDIIQKQDGDDNETQPKKPELTQELTQQLMKLLQEIGYQDPKEALTSIVARHGLSFLLDAFAYLSRLRYVEYRKEMSRHVQAPTAQQDNPVRDRVAKVLFGFIAQALRKQSQSTVS